jgi:hypothetical protein
MAKIVETTPEKPFEKTPQKTSNHFKDLILLFSIPIGISLLAAAIVYIPRMMAKPAHDFVYSYCSEYDCIDPYSATSDGQITKRAAVASDRSGQYSQYDTYDTEAKLGYYDVSTGATQTISFEDARKYQLSTSSLSPDGYSLVRVGDDGGFLFGGSTDKQWYLEDGLKKKPVKLSGSDPYYSNNINFLGWVKQ